MADIQKGYTFTNGETVTPAKLHALVDDATVADGSIGNSKISNTAAIADTKLATINTAGKVSNSATTATSANTANAIVARDASGNFTAGTITANLTGNASGTASTWATARNLSLTGDVTATLSSVNGSANVSAAATIANNAVTTAKIADGNVTNAKLATGAVTGAAGGGKIAASAITAQTVIADPLADTDEFLVHDASASALRKVAYSNIAPIVTAAKLDGVAKDGSGADIAAGTAPIFGCRAWVNFDGTRDTSGTVSTANTNRLIRASGNVASVLKTATGRFTITFTTAMPNRNYCVTGSANFSGSIGWVAAPDAGTTPTAASFSIATVNLADFANMTEVNVCVFR